LTYYRVFNPTTRSFTFQAGLGPWTPATIQSRQTMENVVLGPNQLANLRMLGVQVSEYGAPKTSPTGEPRLSPTARRIKVTLGKPKQC
jgi:hypothetical protein